MSNKYKFETLQLHVGQEHADPATDARAVPIYQTTSYVFHNSSHAAARFGLADAGNIYGRLTNSTQGVLEDRVAALEGGSAGLALASGAAAVSYTIEALAANGGHIVAQKTIYGGSFNLLEHTLPQYGIKTTFVDIHNLQETEAAIQPDTRAIYIETLGNPNSDIPDPQWMEIREFICPECGTLHEVEAAAPGYPVVHDFEPDLEGFYREWLGRPLE